MAYAPDHRAFYDADSHIMELPNFLQKYADPDLRDVMPAVSYSASIVTDEEVAIIMDRGGCHSDEHRAELLAMGDSLIERSKEIQALGAFDRDERSQAVNLLGFTKQLVFATHSVALPFSATSGHSTFCHFGGSGNGTAPLWATALTAGVATTTTGTGAVTNLPRVIIAYS